MMQTVIRKRFSFLGSYVAMALMIMNCATIRKIVDPVDNPILDKCSQASLISVDVPPITLTPERTAAERQLIGEEKQLLPNGWLISSSSYLPPASSALSELPTHIQAEYRMLVLYDDILLKYRYLSFIGEAKDGFVFFVPSQLIGRSLATQERQRLQSIVNEVNRSRKQIYSYYSAQSSPVAESFRQSFFLSATNHEWVRDTNGQVVRKSNLLSAM